MCIFHQPKICYQSLGKLTLLLTITILTLHDKYALITLWLRNMYAIHLSSLICSYNKISNHVSNVVSETVCYVYILFLNIKK